MIFQHTKLLLKLHTTTWLTVDPCLLSLFDVRSMQMANFIHTDTGIVSSFFWSQINVQPPSNAPTHFIIKF